MDDSYDEYGEARGSRSHPHRRKEDQLHDDDEFSMSSYDGELTDSLIIKPPQAVVQHRDKREKREKRERHRHKGDRHKDRHRNRERASGHEERRREHRRHRDRDPERREAKRHDKRRERSPKHERPAGDLRNKLDKDRKINEREQKRRREKARERDEFYVDDRDLFDFRQHPSRGSSTAVHHRGDRRQEDRNILMQGALMDLELSPKEKAEKEKRMERFMAAEKQKEITQKEADTRRQKREEDRREEKRMSVLRRRAEASMLRNTSPRTKRKQAPRPHIEPETVELISDEDNLFLEALAQAEEENRRERKKKKRKKEEVVEEMEEEVEEEEEKEVEHEEEQTEEKETHESPARSSSSGQTSDSDSSSNSSSDEDDEGDDANDEDGEASKNRDSSPVQGKKSPSSASSTDDTADDDKKDSDSGNDDYLDESPAASPIEMKELLPSYFPAIMGCRSVDEFECLNRIEEGTYGVVYRAREKSTNEIVALKRLKMEKEKEGFPITSLREVNTLLKGQHENIVTVREIVVGSNMDKIYIVMDYVEHDLKSLMETMRKKKQTFTIGEIKTIMIQLLRAVHHLHDNWILHRDLKTSNLLLSHRGILKVGDFGLAREYGSPLKQYTPIVVTLWYRAPELLLGCKQYSCPIDVWSLGCIFGELLGMEPMFPGKSEIDMLNKIFKDLGTPSDKIWPGYSQMPVIKKTQFANYPFNNLKERFKSRLSTEGFNLLNSFLTYNPAKRITSFEAMKHDYFNREEPAPIDPAMFPTWPAKSENPHGVRGTKKEESPKPPSGGKYFKDMGEEEDQSIAGFFLGGAPSSGPGFTLKF